MPDKQYDLTAAEQQEVAECAARIARHGGLFACDEAGELLLGAAGRPIPLEFIILRTRRYLVDHEGIVWRYFAEGARKNPGAPDGGGAPCRNNRIEMWNGKYHRVTHPDGRETDEKSLFCRPIDKRINGQPGLSQIAYYRTRGYRHPLEEGGLDNKAQAAAGAKAGAGAAEKRKAHAS